MKKAIVLMLAVVLMMSLTVPAAAATASPKAPETSETVTAPLPEVVVPEEIKDENGTEVVVEIVAADAGEEVELKVEEKQTLATAQKALETAAPEGMKTQYFFFVKIAAKVDANKVDANKVDANKGAAKTEVGPVSISVKIDNAEKVVVKQFVNGKWVERKVILNEDGTVTIEGVEEGPIAIFTE